MARGDGYSVIKRRRNGRELRNYEVRIQVPAAWQAMVGKKEVLLSLATGDRRAANLAAPQVVADKYAEWRRLAGDQVGGTNRRRTPTDDELEAIAVEFGYDTVVAYEDIRRQSATGVDAWTRLSKRAEINRDTYRRMAATGDDSLVRGFADLAVDELGLDLTPEQHRKLGQLMSAARVAAAETAALRTAGEVEAEYASPLVERVRQHGTAMAKVKAKAGETIMEQFERMADEALAKDSLRSDTVNQNRKVLQLFADFVGPDRAIDSITAHEVCEFRDARRDVPPKWSMKRDFRGLSLRAAADKARGLSLPKTSFVTVNRELSTISPLYAWLAGQPRWAGLRNPCDGLFHQKVKGKNPRPPYETDALNKILTSPLFTGFVADDKEYVPGNVHADDWRKWIPLVAMFTGARAGEIAQLRVRDVRNEHGTWFIHLIEDAEAGLAVKNRKRRVAPVHSKLEAIGFIAFVERRREDAGADAPLFPELEKNERDQIGSKPSDWFRDYLAAIGVKNHAVQGGDGFGLHSFRHTLADRLRSEAELLNEEVGVCLGHSVKSTTSGYGRLPQGTVKMLKEWMEAVTWEGVEFTPVTRAAA
jgi:integrase